MTNKFKMPVRYLEENNKVTLDLNENFDFTKTSCFLIEKVNVDIFELRLNKLKEILDLLIDEQSRHNPILIIDYSFNMEGWITSIKSSLPKILKDSLVFNLYTNVVKENCLDCIVSNSDIASYNADLSFSNIFDFTKAIGNSLMTNSNYSKLVQVGYLLNDNKFEEFKSFFDQFQYKSLDSNIDSCLMLFYLSLTGIGNLNYKNLVSALEFAEKYESIYLDINLFDKLNLSTKIDEDMATILASFMIKVSLTSKKKVYFSKTYTFVFDYIQRLLQDSSNNDISKPYDFYNNINLMEKANIVSLFDFISNKDTISELSNYVANKETKFARFYLTLVLQILKLNDNKWNENFKYFDLIGAAISILINDVETLINIFNIVNDNSEYLENLLLICYEKSNSSENSAIELFIGIVDNSSTFKLTPSEVRKFFNKSENGNELLFEEFKYRLIQSDHKTDFYTTYWNETNNRLNKYKDIYFPKSLYIYLQSIQNDSDYSIVCYTILEQIKKDKIQLTKELLTDLVYTCEKALPLVYLDEHEESMLRTISEIKAERSISTSPNIVGFINLGEKLVNVANNEKIRQLISNTSLDLNNIDFSRYEEWLDFCIPIVIGTANTWQMHSYIKKVLCEDKLKGIFFTKYVGMISDELSKNTSEAYNIFIQFIIYFINAKKEIGEENYIQIRSNIINILLRFTESKLCEIDKLLNTALANSRNKDLIINEWRQLQNKVLPVANLEKGFFGKVFKIANNNRAK